MYPIIFYSFDNFKKIIGEYIISAEIVEFWAELLHLSLQAEPPIQDFQGEI